MRISLNWLKKFVRINVSDDELVRLIGARLVEVEEVIDETSKYNNIYVVKVASAEKIDGTHLTLCQIDAGEVDVPKVEKNSAGLIQVVCGAPNVRVGMLAAWIAPGAIVPASVHEDAPFVIGKRKMLGKFESNGMLAGADELDFGDDHSGIAEIDPMMAKAGDKLADVFELDDKILDIENKSLTHRPDCFGMIGFAREVAGILGEKFNEPVIGASDRNDGYGTMRKSRGNAASGYTREVEVAVASADICARYTALVLEKHGEIKKKYLTWQDTILSKSGMRPVSPIVDATNYIMLLTGQPLHAFDYDKFVKVGGDKEPKIVVRLARKGESLELIDGKTAALNENDIVICSNDIPVALAGAMGGASTEIDDDTKNIILESATFSLYNLRKTQMEHGIFSEAITRFTKGQPAYQTLLAAEACVDLLSDGFRVTGMTDKVDGGGKDIVVKITTMEINRLLGTGYDDDLVIKTLSSVGFVVKNHKGELMISVPEWRTDIHIKEDIIEEVGRLLGYDNIMPTLPRHQTADGNKIWNLKSEIRETLRSFGANEVLTYSFVSERLIKKSGLNEENSYKIVNSISPDLQLIRQSIVPSLLDKAYMNQKMPIEKFALFEMNKVYRKEWGVNDEGVPVEKTRLGFVIAERKNSGTAYYAAKKYVEKMLSGFGIEVEFLPIKKQTADNVPFEEKRAAEMWCGGSYLGVVGEFKNSVRRNFKLAEYLAGFEVDVEEISRQRRQKNVGNDFGVKAKEDLTLTTGKSYADALMKVQTDNPGATISPVGIYRPENSEERNITFHIEK